MVGARVKKIWLTHRNAIGAVLFVLAVTVLALRTLTLINEPGKPDPSNWGMRDYRDAIYYPVVSWIEGNNPYDAKSHMTQYPVGQLFPLYSPLTLLIHLPFGMLPFVVSEFMYFVFCIVLSVTLAFLALRITHAPVKSWSLFGFAALILISRPGHMNLVLGQTALLATLFSWLAIYTADRGQWMRSGAFLMFATFKPTFGLLLFPLLLAKRQFAAAIFGLVLTLVFTGLMGITIVNRLPEDTTLTQLLDSNRQVFEEHIGVNSFSTFSRDDVLPLINKCLGRSISSFYERVVTAVLVLITSLVIWFHKSPTASKRSDGLVNALVCVTVIIAIYHHTYDTLILCVPWLAITVASNAEWKQLNKPTRYTLITLLTVPAVNFLSTNTVTSYLVEGGNVRMLITSINGCCLLASWLILATMCCTKSIPFDRQNDNATRVTTNS